MSRMHDFMLAQLLDNGLWIMAINNDPMSRVTVIFSHEYESYSVMNMTSKQQVKNGVHRSLHNKYKCIGIRGLTVFIESKKQSIQQFCDLHFPNLRIFGLINIPA